MNVLHLSTFENRGGAARGAFRLHRGLRELGIGSRMAVQVRSSDDPSIIAPATRLSKLGHEAISILDRVPLTFYRRRAAVSFDVQWLGSCRAASISSTRPDILHLHWVTGGFLRIETLRKFGGSLVWTLRDMWPFTGGCHVSGDCRNYEAACGACWQLGSRSHRDLTRWVWSRKKRAWRRLDLTLVAPSRWMAESARSSSLFRERRITVIPNGLDTSTFKPLDRVWARRALGLEPDRPVILFGAVNVVRDSNKGLVTLQEAISVLAEKLGPDRTQLLIFGCSQPAGPPRFAYPARYLGQIDDETTMALAYNAADLLVVPSRQESFCHTAAEALACGIPVVAFDATGPRDIVDHLANGYLARPYDPEDLAHGIRWILESDARTELALRARRKAEQTFDVRVVARRYADLYAEILDGAPRSR